MEGLEDMVTQHCSDKVISAFHQHRQMMKFGEPMVDDFNQNRIFRKWTKYSDENGYETFYQGEWLNDKPDGKGIRIYLD